MRDTPGHGEATAKGHSHPQGSVCRTRTILEHGHSSGSRRAGGSRRGCLGCKGVFISWGYVTTAEHVGGQGGVGERRDSPRLTEDLHLTWGPGQSHVMRI